MMNRAGPRAAALLALTAAAAAATTAAEKGSAAEGRLPHEGGLPAPPLAPAVTARSKVFVAGQGGYKAYRIPGIVAAYPRASDDNSSVVLIAYAEGRKNGCGDYDGQHDIVLKRSTDDGASWGPLQVVADPRILFNCTGGDLPSTG